VTDHELVTRMARASSGLGVLAAQGRAVLAHDGQLSADALDEIAATIEALAAAMFARAREIRAESAVIEL
jgi:hypothetical protein